MKKFYLFISILAICLTAFAEGEITSIPDGGTKVYYNRNSRSYYPYEGAAFAKDDKGSVQEITYFDNGDVYLFQPYAALKTDVYLKGYKDGDDKIVFPLPQPVRYDEDLDMQYYATRVVYRSEFGSLKPSNDQNLVFNIEEDGTIRMEGTFKSLNEVVLLGYTDEYNIWRFYAEQCMELKPLPEDFSPVAVPENVELSTWRIISNETYYNIQVGFDNNDVYFKGIYDKMPEAAVKGVIDGDKIYVEDSQYMGVYDGHFIYMLAINFAEYYDPDYNGYLSDVEWIDKVTFKYDAENMLMTSDNAIMFNAGKENFNEMFTLYDPVVKSEKSSLGITNPQNPVVRTFIPVQEWEDGEYGKIVFETPILDNNYNVLDKNRLFFEIFVNDDTAPYVFRRAEYMGVDVDTSRFPWGFSDHNNFQYEPENFVQHAFFWPDENVEFFRMGVRQVYLDGGITYYSDIVYSDGEVKKSETGSIASADVDKQVVGSEYYDMSGRRVVNPENGFYIQVSKYADGTFSAKKIVK